MRILLLITELFNGTGGIKAFNNFLVKALLDLGHSLKIVAMNDTKNFSNDLHSNLFTPIGRYGFLKKIIFIVNALRQVVFFRPELIICGHINFSPLCIVINRLFKIPYFTITHGIEVWSLKRLKLKGLAKSSKILSVSNFTKQKILQQLPNYSEKDIFILPNTFDSERFKPVPKPEYLMKRWNIKNGDKVILTVARLAKSEQYKGYDRVITALNDISNVIPNLKYIIVGSGDDAERIKELIRKHHLEGKVILTGFITDEEIVAYYNLCDVFVMPSKGEGFGIVFLEALACGKPVIAGNKSGSVDAVLKGDVGILVDPDNLTQIKEAIVNVLSGNCDPRLLDKEYLRNRVCSEFGFDKYKERLGTILRGI